VTPRHPTLQALLAALALSLTPGWISAQSVLVMVTEQSTSRPLFGAIATLLDAEGGVVRSALTDERGRFLFVGMGAGTYRVRAEMIGHASITSEAFTLEAGASLVRVLALPQQAIEMEGIAVEARRGRCSVRPAEGLQVARVWDEARKALAASALTDRERVYRYRTLRYVRDLERGTLAVRNERKQRSSGYLRTPFESRPAKELMNEGFVRPAATGDLYFAPDADVLLSDAFLDTHCFRLKEGKKDKETEGLVGLAFQPVRGREIPDISGVLWLDPTNSVLRWLEYRYEYINRDFESNLVGGRVDFQRLPDGTWIIPEWWIRMPTVGISRDAQGRRRSYVAGYRQVGGLVTQVQESTGQVVVEAAGGTVEGIVLDSLEADPLPGATVRLVGSEETAVTGADGRFRFSGLPEGTYRVAYTHPYTEGLGYTPEPETVDVKKGQVVAVRFVAPAAVDIVAESCGEKSRIEGTAALLGWVWSGPDRRGLADATVRITWSGYSFKAIHPYQVRGRDPDRGDGWWFRAGEREEGVEINTDRRGFFRVCAVPEEVPLRVTARYGSDSSKAVSVRIPPDVAAQGVELTVAGAGQGDVDGQIVPDTVKIEGVQVQVRSPRAKEKRASGAARTEVTRADIADIEDRALDLIDVLRVKAGPRLQITTLPSRQGMAVDLCIRTTRSTPSISDQMAFSGTCRPVMVVLNGMILWAPPAGGGARIKPPPGTFRQILSMRPENVERVEFLSPVQAKFRFGDAGRYGALVIETRKGGG